MSEGRILIEIDRKLNALLDAAGIELPKPRRPTPSPHDHREECVVQIGENSYPRFFCGCYAFYSDGVLESFRP